MADADDDELKWIEQSRDGDHQAFEPLVLRYQKMIFALAYRMTGSQADAEDITQESLAAAFYQLGSFRGDSKFSSWLYRIALNRCLNWREGHQRRNKAYARWETELEHPTEDADASATVSASVQAALLRLDEKQRAAVLLTVYEGMNHAEAARILGCSETTVSWRLFAARRKLKKWLAPLSQGASHE
jgi:RNA polymerase sigma-70 factor (ECF subfamily)